VTYLQKLLIHRQTKTLEGLYQGGADDHATTYQGDKRLPTIGESELLILLIRMEANVHGAN
jgi:hypothetical protein